MPGPTPRIILVADDDPVNRRLANALVARAGHQSILVDNGLDALKALAEQHFDLVLLDVHMPGCDGPEVATRVRRGEAGQARANVRIIALTGMSDNVSQQACLDAGMNGVIVKPLSLDSLETLLEDPPLVC